MDKCIDKIPSTLKNFNPLYLEEVVWLECCQQPNCVCKGLSSSPNFKGKTPVQVLITFLLCMNHKRAYSGVPGYENVHSVLSDILTEKSRLGR